MPDKDGFPTPQELIDGTYKAKPQPKVEQIETAQGAVQVHSTVNLNSEQLKAISLIITGSTFVLVAINPTMTEGETEPTGADFHTALHGDKDTLRDAGPHLPDVIARLLTRYGIF